MGDDIFETMSNGLAKDYYTSVIEFLSNGHDAGAHNFSIVASIDQLVMEDDGKGMDKDSIHDFFTKGTDYKRVNLETEDGRQVLGRFGLATLLLRHLGDAYKLETWKNGRKIIVNQDFAKNGWKRPNTKLVRVNEQNPSGTRITITKPRYKLNSEEFNLDKLRSEITWGFPPLRDFKITLNGQEVQKRGVVRYGTEYDATTQISERVRISGSIYYNSHQGKAAAQRLPLNIGVILYVNGRRVGDPQDFGLARMDSRLQGNVLGLIDVYGLPDRIRFDRSGFLRTPSYMKIREHILQILQGMKTDLDSGTDRRAFYNARTTVRYIDQALVAATDRLNGKLKLEGGNKYTLEFDTGRKSGPVARLDNADKIVYINQSNPQLIRRTGKRTGLDLENSLLMASVVAIAEYEAGKGASRTLFSDLNEQIAGVGAKLFEGYQTIQADLRTVKGTDDITPVTELYLNPYRLYDPQEVAHLTGWDVSTIKVLALSCLSPEEMHGAITNTRKIKGDKLRVLLPQLEGFVAAGKLAEPEYWVRDWKYAYNFQVDRVVAAHVGSVDYLKNIGIINPFILVKRGYEKQFSKFLREL